MILLHKQFALGEIPGGKLDAVIIVIDIVDEALVSSFSTLATPARSTSACPVTDTGTA